MGAGRGADPLGASPPFYMEQLFYFVASVVLGELGYYLWLLIDRERSMRQDVSGEMGLIDSIREEFQDG